MIKLKISILVVEDDFKIRRLLKDYLENENYEVTEAENGKEALDKFFKGKFDLVVLDIMLPFINGIDVLKEIRCFSDVPAAFLTAKTEEYDQLEGFNSGADDYIVKPFSPRIFIAKINKLLERSGKLSNEILIGNLKLLPASREVFMDNSPVTFSPKEFDLLVTFIQNKNIVLTRERILDKVWGYNYDGDFRTVDTHIKRVRKKIGDRFIKTIRGSGYIFEVEK